MIYGAHIATAGDLYSVPARAKAMGARVVQIFAGNPRGWRQTVYSKEQGERFRAACREHGIDTLFIHMLYLTSYGTTDDALRQRSIDTLGEMLKTADLLGARGVITHLGSHKGDGFAARVQSVADGILEAIKKSDGAKALTVLENSAGAGGTMGNSLEELAEIHRRAGQHPNIKFCIDTAHLLTSGIEFRTPEACTAMLDRIDATIGLKNVVAMHLNDSKADLNSHRDRHENIGDGFIGNDGFRALLNQPRLQSMPGILEVPGLDNKGPDKGNLDRLMALTA